MNWEKIDSKKVAQIQNSLATKTQRFLGLVIDRIVIEVILFIFSVLLEIIYPGFVDEIDHNRLKQIAFTLPFLLLYYIIMEFSFQKTLGKILLKLKVVNIHDGSKPDINIIAKRTFSRIIGWEALFYLFGNRLWHDNWSDTVVISEKKYAEQEEINEIGNIGLQEE